MVLAVLGLCGITKNPVCGAYKTADENLQSTIIIQVTSRPVSAKYFHNLNTARIGAMRRQRFHYKGMHNPGITLAEHELKTHYQIGGLKHGRRGPYSVWAENVHLDFSYIRMDVYISSQYAVGTCPYNVILDHENQHVAINTTILTQYKDLMQKALLSDRTIPVKTNPLSVASLPRGKALIAARINNIVRPIYERFKKELLAENEKIDTLENYRRTQAKCQNW
jgi:hypothetical protein